MSDPNANQAANAILALIGAVEDDNVGSTNPMASLFADVGPSDNFMSTQLTDAGITDEDLARIKGKVQEAVANNDVATINKVLKTGVTALGFLKDVLV